MLHTTPLRIRDGSINPILDSHKVMESQGDHTKRPHYWILPGDIEWWKSLIPRNELLGCAIEVLRLDLIYDLNEIGADEQGRFEIGLCYLSRATADRDRLDSQQASRKGADGQGVCLDGSEFLKTAVKPDEQKKALAIVAAYNEVRRLGSLDSEAWCKLDQAIQCGVMTNALRHMEAGAKANEVGPRGQDFICLS